MALIQSFHDGGIAIQRCCDPEIDPFENPGQQWRALRNILHRLLTPAMSKSYSPIQEFEAKQFTVDLLDRPEDFYMHNRRYAASVIMNISYGH
jgi:cytochrome P450